MKPVDLWREFKTFAVRGNLIDLALAVVIGAAFTKVVDGLVKHIIMPSVNYVLPGQESYREWKVGQVEVGAFLGELVNFLVIALVMFVFFVKLLGAVHRLGPEPGPGAPTTKECPLCLSVVPFQARKCAHCTSDLPPGD